MAWKPTQLSKAQLEERRFKCAELFTTDELDQKRIALELEVSSASISKWHAKWLEGGSKALTAKPHLGPGKSISAEDQQKLLDAVKLGALHWGFTVDRWTAQRIADVCQRVTGIDFHPDHVRKLMRELGFSPQKPQRKAVERDETAIAMWLKTTHPEILKRGARKTRRSSTATKNTWSHR